MPSITFVARSMRLSLSTLLTKGKLRDARRLHSITFMSLFLARNWMLNGPEMFRASAICADTFLMRRMVSTYSFCGGNWMVASPECTPANSMCSEMAYALISPFCATASISISLAFCTNSVTTTGCCFDTFAARRRNR